MAESDDAAGVIAFLVGAALVILIATVVIAATVTAGAAGGAGHAVLNYARALRDNTARERPGA